MYILVPAGATLDALDMALSEAVIIIIIIITSFTLIVYFTLLPFYSF